MRVTLRMKLLAWWYTRDWRRRQREFERTGTRYYGDGETIHRSTELDVETYKGEVVAVWFRCQHLPFRQTDVAFHRAKSMRSAYADASTVELHGVEVKDLFGK